MLLKPCPFCGRQPELRLDPSFGSDNPTKYWRIFCECPMGSPDANYDEDKFDDIIKDWNTRKWVEMNKEKSNERSDS